jgi:hypothetical protein
MTLASSVTANLSVMNMFVAVITGNATPEAAACQAARYDKTA